MYNLIKCFLFSKLLKTYWKIGFFKLGSAYNSIDVNNIRWVKFNHKEKWYADPFILDVTDNQILLLVEEYRYDNPKGIITLLEIEKSSGRILFEKKILDLDTHLSFPIILREGNKVFVYPENSRSGSTFIYEYDKANKELINREILIKEPLADPVLLRTDKGLFVLGTRGETKNGNILEIFKIDKIPSSKYIKCQEIVLPDNSARNGGDIITEEDGRLIKVSQESNKDYGHSIVFYEICEDENGFYLREESRIEPFFKSMIGIHTFNVYKSYGVVDTKYYMYPRLGKIVEVLLSLLQKFRSNS